MCSWSSISLQILFTISSSQSGKNFLQYQVQEDFSKKKKSLALSNKTNTLHSKYYCKFIWKYYRDFKKKKKKNLFLSEIGKSTCVINH